jgi:hypothetical protein
MSGNALQLVGLHGAPRSGTSWLGQLFNSSPQVAYRYQPFFAHAFRTRVGDCRTPADFERLLEDIGRTDDDFILQRGAANLARRELSFPKRQPTCLLYKEVRFHQLLPVLMRIERFRGVALVRNPLEVLASWVRAPREFKPEWSLAEEWRFAPSKNQGRAEEFYGYEGWKRAALIFRALEAEYPHRFRIVAYGELRRDPLAVLSPLFDMLGLELTDQTRRFAAQSTSVADDDPYGVFRNGAHSAGSAPLPEDLSGWIIDDLRREGLDRWM